LISSGNAADVRSGLIAEANRDGVIGFANFDGWGVYGYSPDAVGVGGFSENGVDFYASGTGRIAFEPHLPLGPPTDATGEYLAGEIVRDEQGNICSTSCPTPSARCPRSAALRFPHAVNARSPCSPPYPQAPPPSPGR